MRPKLLALAVASALCSAAHGAPDEEELGQAGGYSFQRLGPDFSLLTDRYKVGNLTSMEQIFWAREIAPPPTARPLAVRDTSLNVSYEYNGQRS